MWGVHTKSLSARLWSNSIVGEWGICLVVVGTQFFGQSVLKLVIYSSCPAVKALGEFTLGIKWTKVLVISNRVNLQQRV